MCINGTTQAPPRDMGREMDATLKAEVANAPALYAAEAKYQPLYAQLGVENFRTALNGTPGQKGILSLYADDIAPVMARAAGTASATQRTADVADLQRLGPAAVAAIRAANPEQAALLTALNTAALDDMREGSRLDPGLRREAQQSIRSAQAARGFGLGGNDAAEEVMFTTAAADRLRQQRRAFASSIAGLNMATNVDPALAILGRPSTAANPNLVNQGAAGATGNRANLFDPLNPYASDVNNTNFNAASAWNINKYNARQQQNAAILSAVGSFAGSAMGGGGYGCWIAREVFGEENPQWQRFRWWMRHVGPGWFERWYLRHGARVAAWLRDKPAVKALVRVWMEGKIAGCTALKGGAYAV